MSLLLVVCTGVIVAGGVYRCVIVGGVYRCVLLVVVLHTGVCHCCWCCVGVGHCFWCCVQVSFTGVHRCVSFLMCTGV